jgi:hypothetical protein
VHRAELAASARTPQLKATLPGLSKQWEKLAIDLEKTQALLDGEAVEFKKLC